LKDRRTMIEENTEPSVRRQCELLRVSRSGFYYEPEPTSAEELELMRCIDELHLKWPFYGSRKLALELKVQGHDVNRKRVQRLMRLMSLEAMAPKPDTSRPAPEHLKYPYLLRGLRIFRPDQVWATDITYIPLQNGFAYLVAIMDWYSRRVLAWRVSNTLDTGFCLEALQEAFDKFGRPDIFNTDQGSQFTADDFTSLLRSRGVKISMDGKGRCIDNIFVERLWRSLKYEEVYLHAYESVAEARVGIGRYFEFYNRERRHQGLNYETPDAVYRETVTKTAA
jgi:putative transposase